MLMLLIAFRSIALFLFGVSGSGASRVFSVAVLREYIDGIMDFVAELLFLYIGIV